MGLEVVCRVEHDGRVGEGKALLETQELLFRGDFRLKIPFKSIRKVGSNGGRLAVVYEGGAAIFELGPAAEKWELKIRNPRGRLQKLGVKPESRVAILGVKASDFLKELKALGPSFAKTECDVVFFAAEGLDDLEKLRSLEPMIARDGAIWVVYPKGQKHIREIDVLNAGKSSGYVDVKVCAFSDTHTALKMVIPVSRR